MVKFNNSLPDASKQQAETTYQAKTLEITAL